MHGQQYKTYLGWKKVGRQVRKGEHGEKDHLGETVFGFDQTDEIRSRRRIERDLEIEQETRRFKDNREAYNGWRSSEDDFGYDCGYDPD